MLAEYDDVEVNNEHSSGSSGKKSILHPLSTHDVVAYCDEKLKGKDLIEIRKRRKDRLKRVEAHERAMYNYIIIQVSNTSDIVNTIKTAYHEKEDADFRVKFKLLMY